MHCSSILARPWLDRADNRSESQAAFAPRPLIPPQHISGLFRANRACGVAVGVCGVTVGVFRADIACGVRVAPADPRTTDEPGSPATTLRTLAHTSLHPRLRPPARPRAQVAPTVWASAHTTQFTAARGWRYAAIGAGAGALVGGGSFVALTDAAAGTDSAAAAAAGGDANNVTIVIEKMTYDYSRCISDTRETFLPPFEVATENATFALLAPPAGVVAAGAAGAEFAAWPFASLRRLRSCFGAGDGDAYVEFEELPPVALAADPTDGALSFVLEVGSRRMTWRINPPLQTTQSNCHDALVRARGGDEFWRRSSREWCGRAIAIGCSRAVAIDGVRSSASRSEAPATPPRRRRPCARERACDPPPDSREAPSRFPTTSLVEPCGRGCRPLAPTPDDDSRRVRNGL